jgi:hypothetical protein
VEESFEEGQGPPINDDNNDGFLSSEYKINHVISKVDMSNSFIKRNCMTVSMWKNRWFKENTNDIILIPSLNTMPFLKFFKEVNFEIYSVACKPIAGQ